MTLTELLDLVRIANEVLVISERCLVEITTRGEAANRVGKLWSHYGLEGKDVGLSFLAKTDQAEAFAKEKVALARKAQDDAITALALYLEHTYGRE